jgi:uncharacterized protein (TIGR02922 family)
MSQSSLNTITVIYFQNDSLELQHQTLTTEYDQKGRAILSASFKQNKSIVAVCKGNVELLNKIGDRV